MTRVHSEELDVIERIILEWVLEKYGEKLWIGFIWLKIRYSDELLRSR
jgi:hypothetical protein